jgi:hypothetical protein
MRASGVDVQARFGGFYKACTDDNPALPYLGSCRAWWQSAGAEYVRVPGHESRNHCVHLPRAVAAGSPSRRPPREGYPLVVFMHGYTSNGAETDSYFHISSLAESRGFIAVLPDGTTNTAGTTFWSATDACCSNQDHLPVQVCAKDTVFLPCFHCLSRLKQRVSLRCFRTRPTSER